MGMAAGQARLLSITARLSDNEQSGQSVSYAKQRLADQTGQIQAEYNAALSATKLTVITGFSGSEPQYTDISYATMTDLNTAINHKQYVLTDKSGKVLVSNQIALAFNTAKGDYNKFLAELGYSQTDISVKAATATEVEAEGAEQKIHDAWDKYLTSVGKGYGDDAEHDWGFTGGENGDIHNHSFGWTPYTSGSTGVLAGYPTIEINGTVTPINYEGTTKEQRQLYDYAVAISESYYGNSATLDLKTLNNVTNKADVAYYQNLYNQMLSNGFHTYTSDYATATAQNAENPGTFKYLALENGQSKSPLVDSTVFVEMLKQGELQIKYYNVARSEFVATTISEDQAIVEVRDERAMALAEVRYEQQMTDLERKDKRMDLELKKLDTEHNTLQTEYDSVKNVIDKNVEKSFSIFS